MAVGGLKELKRDLVPRKRLLGLDLGEKTIGMAVCDDRLSIAMPLHTLRRSKFTLDIEAMKVVIRDYDIGGIVIGLPINMDGTEGPRCQSVRHFGDNLLKLLGDMPVLFWDERLTTHAAERFLIEEAGLSREKRAAVVDKMAAAHILQGALDALAKEKA